MQNLDLNIYIYIHTHAPICHDLVVVSYGSLTLHYFQPSLFVQTSKNVPLDPTWARWEAGQPGEKSTHFKFNLYVSINCQALDAPKTQVKAKPHGTTMYSLLSGTMGRREKKGAKEKVRVFGRPTWLSRLCHGCAIWREGELCIAYERASHSSKYKSLEIVCNFGVYFFMLFWHHN